MSTSVFVCGVKPSFDRVLEIVSVVGYAYEAEMCLVVAYGAGPDGEISGYYM